MKNIGKKSEQRTYAPRNQVGPANMTRNKKCQQMELFKNIENRIWGHFRSNLTNRFSLEREREKVREKKKK